ncbi:hypothetical protein GH741_06820 [Aquibacillus halophilus]|uniref:DUF3939 domain-containing protein n=1 Tax=Aquibacillus halophilus TaxID=930132 RepID=A0A6A8D9W2_9BACI|nr:hypothetical protein [Aquibacillus halophilus]MRH42394.1 hypothetical protein [Aquibacillus halophilus]
MRYLAIIPLTLSILILSGCLYPSQNLTKNNVPNELQLKTVQDAVTQYAQDNQGLIPVLTKPSDTPIFQKYIIDFSKLKQQNLLASIPGTAFENGGVYQYVLITPEESPTVKLIDLRNAETIRSVYSKINIYRSENTYPPFGEEVEDSIYQINYEKIGLESPPFVVSPYSQKNLPIIMDVYGDIYIDYSLDLYEALNEFEHSYSEGEDIRYILAENYPFVPAYSLPYTIEDGEPVYLKK